MHTNRWHRGVGILVAVSLLSFGANAVQAHPARQLTTVTLVLKWVPQAQFAGYFVAKDKGFYRQQGLNVVIKPGGPDIVPEQVVASHAADFGIDWFSALLVAREKGLPIVNVAQIFQASGMRMITFKSTGITSISQFRSKKVGVWFAGNEYQFMALMHKYGMYPPQKYMTVISQPFVMDPFLNHQMDVAHAMTYNELGVVLEHGVPLSNLRVFNYNNLGVSILEDGIFSTPSYLQSHHDVAVRFLKASIMGWHWAIHHPTQAGVISFRHAPKGTTTLFHQKYMAREVAKLIMYGGGKTHPIGYMDPQLFNRTWHTLLQQGVIKHMPHGSYNQLYWQLATAGMGPM